MKKSTKIILGIIIAVFVVATIIITCVFASLNKEKTSMTAEAFKTKMEEKGYHIIDAIEQFAAYDYVKKAYLATSEDYSYKIEFYELEDDNYATLFYNNNKAILEASKGSASAENSIAIKNYAKYSLSSNGKYMVVSRINNTVLYVSVEETYKDAVKGIIEEIDY